MPDEIDDLRSQIAALQERLAEMERDKARQSVLAAVLEKTVDLDLNNLPEPLTQRDRDILQSMLELEATIGKPVPGDAILRRACGPVDNKHACVRLVRCGLVAGKAGVGRYLTPKGIKYTQQFFEDIPVSEAPADDGDIEILG